MRYAWKAALEHRDHALVAALPAGSDLARAAVAVRIAFGTRPGNVIGTGGSPAIADYASNITEVSTPTRIAPRMLMPQPASEAPDDLPTPAIRALDAGRTRQVQEALEPVE